MSEDSTEKKLYKIRLVLVSHLSALKLKVEGLEGRYISLCKEIGLLEERVRILEKLLESMVFRAFWKTMVAIGGVISTIYLLVMIWKSMGS